ncbi:hypothetical protein BC830DRAFT_1154706 [Chytriomyces sp. MP71]|nr:hypothetical protein BC830DRAFT_1154706 [Chytriomyces sp. MP71]
MMFSCFILHSQYITQRPTSSEAHIALLPIPTEARPESLRNAFLSRSTRPSATDLEPGIGTCIAPPTDRASNGRPVRPAAPRGADECEHSALDEASAQLPGGSPPVAVTASSHAQHNLPGKDACGTGRHCHRICHCLLFSPGRRHVRSAELVVSRTWGSEYSESRKSVCLPGSRSSAIQFCCGAFSAGHPGTQESHGRDKEDFGRMHC